MAMQMDSELDHLTLEEHGAALFRGAILSHLESLEATVALLPAEQAGVRISGFGALETYVAPDGPLGQVARQALGTAGKAVRAILFDKTESTNWSLAWHQDRTICVRQRADVEGYGPWSMKAGLLHVAPPFDLLARMVTLRVHLDDVPLRNAPLLIAPGSHKIGRVSADHVEETARRCGPIACTALAGDVWAYSTPILHASEAAIKPRRRRVLQIDFSAEELPEGLAWLGVT
ncbi:hypothetical protein FHT45_003706 [Novosphingobium sp. BK256]|nr:phytanoyl-CoA dioxygenase family protein [Novosphingobium sp. BK626]MBB3359864.1 hypothetical protein [Novosphingobium sp. BK256]MBB3422367.1 hypothetical protein [Novosphingobium sp. BK267]MBB3502810.1 hypothetical protein [Novosphingobium sp. BK336]MBB3558070.1 hypothetical protein [Novosphingobium sp. BK349]MBB3654044.1 hypothetical protein [Novosphingobium sp. BK626]